MEAGGVLLIEDDDGIAVPLARALAREGYDVRRATTGDDAVTQVRRAVPALVILDLGLPDMDGLEVCRQLRDDGMTAPVLILTARGEELDRVVGLDAGADDYLAKPFGLAELLARSRALLRRAGSIGGTVPTAEVDGVTIDVRVDRAARRAWVREEELHLSAKEWGLLELLLREVGAAVTRETCMDEVWDEHWFGSTKTLDVTMARLRQKMEAAGCQTRIVTVRGVGFRLEVSTADA